MAQDPSLKTGSGAFPPRQLLDRSRQAAAIFWCQKRRRITSPVLYKVRPNEIMVASSRLAALTGRDLQHRSPNVVLGYGTLVTPSEKMNHTDLLQRHRRHGADGDVDDALFLGAGVLVHGRGRRVFGEVHDQLFFTVIDRRHEEHLPFLSGGSIL